LVQVRSSVLASTADHGIRQRGLAYRGCSAALAAIMTLSGCSAANSVKNSLFGAPSSPAAGTPGQVTGFLGGVVADEPRAALAAREVLSGGGNATDAAVALAFAITVTLPSRAGLGGGGGCIAFSSGSDGAPHNAPGDVPNAVLFMPEAPKNVAGSDRPAAVPMLARGMYALHARYGSRPFETLVVPAEQMARFGVPASRAFVRDIAVVAGPLSEDAGAGAVFTRNGQPLAEGALLQQPDLSTTLAQIRIAGVGDLYQGALGRRLTDAAAQVHGTFTLADLRAAIPKVLPALTVPAGGGDMAAFLPPPTDGGLAAAASFQALLGHPTALDAARARGLGAATRWRQGGADAKAILAGSVPAPDLPPLPASTSFATLDRNGNAVVCSLTMGNLFGTGRMAPGTGVLLAASPGAIPPPLLSSALLYNPNLQSIRAAIAASGQEAAPLAAAVGLVQSLSDHNIPAAPMPAAAPDPGRLNIIDCTRYLPGESNSCNWAVDPRGAGLAVGSN
jgi:gamma-glutamyltranspeptidase/glutathione hydrolase